MHWLVLAFALALFALDARADHEITAEEQASIVAALEAEGCTGGTYEHDDDDDDYEVDDARCADGDYDVELSKDFKIMKRERDD
jgi:hypothetical protein